MLHLKRVQYFTDFMRCKISGEIISHGDYYYEDDEDGLIVKATVYREMLDEKRNNEFDYSKLQKAETQREYQEALKEYERQFLSQTLLDRKVSHEGVY